ncbi:MAG: dethiobiotin synthase [Polyangiaceae bacterium]
MSARFVVVSGTDTGVGKTVVAAGLARALIRAHKRTLAIKLVESGCDGVATEDGALLAEATGQEQPRRALVRFRAPLAPALAAELEGVPIDVDALARAVRELGAAVDFVIIEGAGGLLAPLSWDRDITHVATALEATVLVVGSDRLGVVNHSLLTLNGCIAGWNVPLGVVLGAPATPDASTGTNVAALSRMLVHHRLQDRVIAIPRVDGCDQAADHLGPVLGWLGVA